MTRNGAPVSLLAATHNADPLLPDGWSIAKSVCCSSFDGRERCGSAGTTALGRCRKKTKTKGEVDGSKETEQHPGQQGLGSRGWGLGLPTADRLVYPITRDKGGPECVCSHAYDLPTLRQRGADILLLLSSVRFFVEFHRASKTKLPRCRTTPARGPAVTVGDRASRASYIHCSPQPTLLPGQGGPTAAEPITGSPLALPGRW